MTRAAVGDLSGPASAPALSADARDERFPVNDPLTFYASERNATAVRGIIIAHATTWKELSDATKKLTEFGTSFDLAKPVFLNISGRMLYLTVVENLQGGPTVRHRVLGDDDRTIARESRAALFIVRLHKAVGAIAFFARDIEHADERLKALESHSLADPTAATAVSAELMAEIKKRSYEVLCATPGVIYADFSVAKK